MCSTNFHYFRNFLRVSDSKAYHTCREMSAEGEKRHAKRQLSQENYKKALKRRAGEATENISSFEHSSHNDNSYDIRDSKSRRKFNSTPVLSKLLHDSILTRMA